MKNKKIIFIAIIPVCIILIMWIISHAFRLISAPSDSSVFYGFLIFGVTLATVILSTLYINNKYFKH